MYATLIGLISILRLVPGGGRSEAWDVRLTLTPEFDRPGPLQDFPVGGSEII